MYWDTILKNLIDTEIPETVKLNLQKIKIVQNWLLWKQNRSHKTF